jgi:hypothetical protein
MNKTITLDNETFLFQPGRMAPKVVCVALRHDDGRRELVRAHDPKVRRALEMVAEGSITLVGHNIAFDMKTLARTVPDLLPLIFQCYLNFNIHDTMLLYKLWLLRRGELSEGGGRRKGEQFSLDYLAQTFANAPKLDKGADGYRNRYEILDPLPLSQWPERAVTYPLDDVEWTYRVYRALGPEDFPDLGRQTAYHFPLDLMSTHGMVTDPAQVKAIEDYWTPIYNHAKDAVSRMGVIRADGSCNTKKLQSVVEAAWRDAGYNPETIGETFEWAVTPAGKFTTAAAALTELSSMSGNEDLKMYSEMNHAWKMLGTYVPLLKRGIHLPIHMGIDSLKATGRTSQFKPSLQTLPRGEKGVPSIREAFIPRRGNVFLLADMDTAEVRAFGQTLLDTVGWSVIADNYRKDPTWDPHCYMGTYIENKGRSYDDALANAKGPDFKEFRNMAKGANFGLPGGMGPKKLIEYVKGYGIRDLTLERATEIRDMYRRAYPETVARANQISAAMDQQGGTFMAKTYRTHRERLCKGFSAYNQARNSDFQPQVADISKLAGLYLAHGQYVEGVDPRLYGTRTFNMVHDEHNVEAPGDAYEGPAEAMSECFERAAKIICPDVPFKSSTAAVSRLRKADPSYDAEGRLEVT